MASSVRFMVASVNFCGRTQTPSEAIPNEFEGKRYSISLRENVLDIEEGGDAIFFAASAVPTDAVAIGMTAVAMPQIIFPDGSASYVVIRRSEKLSTFPGMLSFPGGFMDKWGDQFYGTAMRELEEETGSWCTHMCWSDIRNTAIIDSVPRPDRHNITVVVNMKTTTSSTPEELQSVFIPQPGEVSSVHLMNMEEMKARAAEFTPGIAKFLRAF